MRPADVQSEIRPASWPVNANVGFIDRTRSPQWGRLTQSQYTHRLSILGAVVYSQSYLPSSCVCCSIVRFLLGVNMKTFAVFGLFFQSILGSVSSQSSLSTLQATSLASVAPTSPAISPRWSQKTLLGPVSLQANDYTCNAKKECENKACCGARQLLHPQLLVNSAYGIYSGSEKYPQNQFKISKGYF